MEWLVSGFFFFVGVGGGLKKRDILYENLPFKETVTEDLGVYMFIMGL